MGLPGPKRRDNKLIDQYRRLFILLPLMQDFRGWGVEPVARSVDLVRRPLLETNSSRRAVPVV